MTFQYLLTLVKKTKDEILSILDSLNLCGDVLVGNQLMLEEGEYSIKTSRCNAIVYDLTSKGVSKNRNFLIGKASADYITCLDDDVCYEDGVQEKIERLVAGNDYDAIRFNVVSDNDERPIKQLSHRGFVKFRQISSFGVWGIFFKRQVLLDNNIFFREDIGPGTFINHGEDGLFNKTFLKKSKIFSIPELAFRVKQCESTWQGENRNLESEMFSHGYIYQLLYPKHSRLMANLFIATHVRCYPRETKKAFLKKHMYSGIRAAKERETIARGGLRVLILGPVVSDKVSGGVAVFDEGLCAGFRELGNQCNILSIDKSSNISNLLIKRRNSKPNKILFNLKKIAKEIEKYEPDLVISSLQYSLGIKRYKRKWYRAKYVQVLHGFPCPINGKFKSWAVNEAAKYSRKHFDYVVTVSYLSYAINKKINGIICDKVIHNGCALTPSTSSKNKIYDFIYIGRLFRDKEVEMIGDAFTIIKRLNPKLRLAVAGFGELEPLFVKGKFRESGIEFVGKLSQSQVKDCLGQSRFFISMNPLEPFGTVFNEAVINGCNIVTQSSNGSMALYLNKDYFHCADCLNGNELASRLLEILNNYVEIDDAEKERFIKYMSFTRAAKEYLSLISQDK